MILINFFYKSKQSYALSLLTARTVLCSARFPLSVPCNLLDLQSCVCSAADTHMQFSNTCMHCLKSTAVETTRGAVVIILPKPTKRKKCMLSIAMGAS